MGNSHRKPDEYSIAKSYDPSCWVRDFDNKDLELWINKNTH